MSEWKKQASHLLPELQNTITQNDINSPLDLWLELNIIFEKNCAIDPLPISLLQRIWEYSVWCTSQESDSVSYPPIDFFYADLLESKSIIAALPQIITRTSLERLKHIILENSSEEKYERVRKTLRVGRQWKGKPTPPSNS